MRQRSRGYHPAGHSAALRPRPLASPVRLPMGSEMKSPTSRNTRDREILEFEIRMFRALRTRKLPVELAAKPDWQYVRNALTEALILHTRILVDILLSGGQSPDDIRLKQLLPSFHSQDLDTLRSEYGPASEHNSPHW